MNTIWLFAALVVAGLLLIRTASVIRGDRPVSAGRHTDDWRAVELQWNRLGIS